MSWASSGWTDAALEACVRGSLPPEEAGGNRFGVQGRLEEQVGPSGRAGGRERPLICQERAPIAARTALPQTRSGRPAKPAASPAKGVSVCQGRSTPPTHVSAGVVSPDSVGQQAELVFKPPLSPLWWTTGAPVSRGPRENFWE